MTDIELRMLIITTEIAQSISNATFVRVVA